MTNDKTLMDYIFNKIGDKIKKLAKYFCCVGVVISIIMAISMFGNSTNSYHSYDAESYAILGCIWLSVGPLTSYSISLLIYGFGELIEKTTDIVDIQKNNIPKQ